MVIHQKMAYGIVGGLAEFYKSEEFQDFTVSLGEVQFQCHRLLLAACSDFFRAMFRSQMQETEQKTVTIKDISSEIFELILETIYTGHEIMTNDNVIDIWRAAHQLQIHFLVSECENFVINILSEENYAEFFYISNTLNSAVVLETLWPFVIKNFYSFYQTDCFLHLPMADVLRLVKSQDLETESEDDVIYAILKWSEFQCNQPQLSMANSDGIANSDNTCKYKEKKSCNGEEPARKKGKTYKDSSTVCSSHGNNTQMTSCDERNNQGDATNKDDSCKNLTILLSHARTCLASEICLKMLGKHQLVRDNKEAKDIVRESLIYKEDKNTLNGQWPSRYVFRSNSKFIHCLVRACRIGNDVACRAYSLASQKWLNLPFSHRVEKVELFTIDYDLYALGTTHIDNQSTSAIKNLYLLHFDSGSWTVVKIPLILMSGDFCVILVGSFLYIFSTHDQTVWKLDTTSHQVTKASNLPGNDAIAYVMPYDQNIFVFYASTDEDVDETVVQCYDTTENTWTQLNNLEGPAIGMTSFKDDHFTYLLQSNGALWKVVKSKSEIIDFEFVVKLWNCNCPLHGAVTYLDELYIHGAESDDLCDDLHLRRSLPGVFSKINYIETDGTQMSKSIPLIEKKKYFV